MKRQITIDIDTMDYMYGIKRPIPDKAVEELLRRVTTDLQDEVAGIQEYIVDALLDEGILVADGSDISDDDGDSAPWIDEDTE
jgi:hypothetical protein